ncbi:hypothetical protein BDD12DRAFT_270587 [Trichophaea hybrida]|nr:hypothetical protein BDD12DRAFT_270587 [Trichophaea hybrida]
MDYSAFNSGFADPEEESPFASQHSTGGLAQPSLPPDLNSSGFVDEENDPHFQPYSPDLGSQHTGFGSITETEDIFGTPSAYTGIESPRLEGQQYIEDHTERAPESNGNHSETTERTESQQQQQQPHQPPARYKAHLQQQQQQQQQQQSQLFHLQAKITALERSGRKDPILRFDVHVCHIATYNRA